MLFSMYKIYKQLKFTYFTNNLWVNYDLTMNLIVTKINLLKTRNRRTAK